jgi:hypothetical protein
VQPPVAFDDRRQHHLWRSGRASNPSASPVARRPARPFRLSRHLCSRHGVAGRAVVNRAPRRRAGSGVSGSHRNPRCCVLTARPGTSQRALDRLAVRACKHALPRLQLGRLGAAWRPASPRIERTQARLDRPHVVRRHSGAPGCRGAQPTDPRVRIAPVDENPQRTRLMPSVWLCRAESQRVGILPAQRGFGW